MNYDLWYQLVNKKTEALPLATSHRANAHLCNRFSHVFALLELISMPHFKSINFYQIRFKIKFFCKKKYKIFERWGLRSQTPDITPLSLQISGYAPEPNHGFALLIFVPPEFFLMPRFISINFYQIAKN